VIQRGFSNSMHTTANIQDHIGTDCLPRDTDSKDIPPMSAARMTLGDGPTKNIKPIIRTIDTIFAIGRVKKRNRTMFIKTHSIDIFIPESATMWSVPVLINDSLKPKSNASFVPNNIPDNKPACGSGKTRSIIAVKVPTVSIGKPEKFSSDHGDIFEHKFVDI
jgi:hypothetical protein